jgi:hypothetical protein
MMNSFAPIQWIGFSIFGWSEWFVKLVLWGKELKGLKRLKGHKNRTLFSRGVGYGYDFGDE